MKTWIVVADQREALFYEVTGTRRIDPTDPDAAAGLADDGCRLALKITNPKAKPDRELETDRPGRGHSSSFGQRHGMDGERSTQRSAEQDFAKRIAEEVTKAHQAGGFDRAVLAAGPRMLGLIRAALPDTVRSALAAEVARDLVRLEGQELIDHLPTDAKSGLNRGDAQLR
jgi:protein required for attachment to host cells